MFKCLNDCGLCCLAEKPLCEFFVMKTKKCSIYGQPKWPNRCKIYGTVKNNPCPFVMPNGELRDNLNRDLLLVDFKAGSSIDKKLLEEIINAKKLDDGTIKIKQ